MIDIQRASDADCPGDAQLSAWAESALAAAGTNGELTVRIADEEEMCRLNEDFRGKKGPTNVLSFPFEAPQGLPQGAVALPLGDIIICPQVVAREAREQGKSMEAHWAHMVIHGVLHLCGHDHQQAQQALAMESLEIELLGAAGYPDPYQAEEA